MCNQLVPTQLRRQYVYVKRDVCRQIAITKNYNTPELSNFLDKNEFWLFTRFSIQTKNLS